MLWPLQQPHDVDSQDMHGLPAAEYLLWALCKQSFACLAVGTFGSPGYIKHSN